MLKNRSVATIDAPEFINLQADAINPGISQCEIKVFYLGKNRNGSYIDKNTAIQMANSLPATPIVGIFRKDLEDFGDHGDIIHIENGEIEFSCSTVPYGFVAPDAEVWFQKFIDTDDFGNEIEREYLMTTGYLWTGQYPEIEKCLTEGQPQSMELDDLDGHWSTDTASGIDFFIINDAFFTKLCVLGDSVEPCFEGASVTSPEVSANFQYQKNFSQTLFTMMNELKEALESKGGLNMSEETSVEEQFEETPAVEEAEEEVVEESFEKKEDEEEKPADEENAPEDEDEDEEKKPSQKNSLEEELSELRTSFAALQESFSKLAEETEVLREFKAAREDADKDALIDKYYMLTAEDKAEVIAHKSEYSLAEIESKLALIYVQKNVDFEGAMDSIENDESVVTTFSLADTGETAGDDDPLLNVLRDAKYNL